jgi:hypothetical protein
MIFVLRTCLDMYFIKRKNIVFVSKFKKMVTRINK